MKNFIKKGLWILKKIPPVPSILFCFFGYQEPSERRLAVDLLVLMTAAQVPFWTGFWMIVRSVLNK